MKVKVLEVSQFYIHRTNIEQFSFADFDLAKVTGGDAEAAFAALARTARIYEVEEHTQPSKGYAWYREDKSGMLYRWKFNPDSGD